MKNIFLLILFINYSWVIQVSGQSTKNDDLKLDLQAMEEDTFKVDILNDQSWYYKDINASKSFEFAKEANELSKRIGYLKGEALSLSTLGIYYKNREILDTALIYMTKSLVVRKVMNDSLLISNGYINLAIVQRRMGNYNLSKEYYIKSLEFIELKNKNHQKQMMKIYNGLGVTARMMGDFEWAIENLLKSLAIGENSKDFFSVAKTKLSLGALYHDLGRSNKALNNYNNALIFFKEKGLNKYVGDILNNIGGIELKRENHEVALGYFLKALDIYKANDYNHNRAGIYNNIGLIYISTENYDKALEYFSLSISENSNTVDRRKELKAKINIALVYYKKKKLERAKFNFLESLQLADSLNARNEQMKIYTNLASLNADLSLFDDAYYYNIKYDSLQNSLINSLNTLATLETEYNDRKHEIEIIGNQKELQDSQLKIQALSIKNKTFVIAIQTILLILGGMIFYMLWRNSKLKYGNIIAIKDAKIKDEEIESLMKRNEIESLNLILKGEEKERERISKDLHDRLGSLLSVIITHFQLVKEHLGPNYEKKKSLFIANNLLLEACEEVRKIAKNLSVGFITQFGLQATLNRLINTINDTGKINATLVLHGLNDRLEPEFEINIYRIVQELTGNVLKHSKAKELEIQLIKNGDNLNIMVVDNGNGFDQSQIDEGNGIGLMNVDSRIRQISGLYNIDSVEGRGTTVTIDVPILVK